MSETRSVMVVDDHPLLRRGICQLLTLDDRFTLFAEVGSGVDALAAVSDDEPDLILLDLNMKGMSGLDTLKALRQEQITSHIVILTVSDAAEDVRTLIQSGADGYLLKDSEPEQILDQVELVLNGQQVITERLQAYLLTNDEESNGWWQELTPREQEIARLIAEGMSNKILAEKLFISEGTVKVHVKNLLRKTDCRSRVELAVKVLQS
ncbi:two component transcriptional regulator, LuxR family [Ferrimonas sediminum]|uniref:Two component transcriptional regulator, LuxR family n=1 Tax=Ferrimonas sediminum TaxID=718193 RepID=A0A1G8V210_9GAMM|nr:response regulator [Ferrimonas sediminum]SDJ60103.1 two component transcriptional regulator, LuxR family [Ferrimonas sediminum]